MELMSYLFDKTIKVELIYSGDSSDISETIDTPLTGRKPLISVKGKMTGGTFIQGIELRLTNLYTSKLYSDYKAVKITAGYSQGEKAEIYGSILNAYRENPPPDSVTVFEILTGDLNKWSNVWITRSFDKGTTVQSLFSEFSNLLGISLNWQIKNVLVLNAVVNFNCLVQDAVFKLKTAFPNLVVRPDYKELNVCDEKEGSQRVFNIDYVKSAKKDAAGFTIISVWNPAIRPMDTVVLNPLYFKQSFGGQNVSGSNYTVISIDFEMDTRDTNNMNLISVGV
jgi:hypothetical protein